jgi:hypothetical protein
LVACDPSEDSAVALEGPPFLIVAPSADQPTSPEEGTTIYVQARGGTFVGITTYGGTHRYSALISDATESCAELPGSEPLYLLVKPDDEECVVEARLYADCDPNEGGTALQMCNDHSSFVESVILPVVDRRFNRAATTSSFDASVVIVPKTVDAGHPTNLNDSATMTTGSETSTRNGDQ